jgi:uncharacterized protein (DUF1697 family)
LLRGINVSGQKIVKMADMKTAFESLSFENVRTYGQSGNVIFDCERAETAELVKRVEEKISETFGFSTNVIIRTQQELENIIDNNPLTRRADVALDKVYITFLRGAPDETVASSITINSDDDEKFAVVGKEVYLYCPNGYARTKLNNTTFEKKLKTVATTRNWKTIKKLLGI